MRLTEKYRPRGLADIVGQPPVTLLKSLAADPYECSLLLEGPPGCGKTTAALALAHDLGCEDDMSGLHVVPCSEFSVDVCRQMFEQSAYGSGVLRLRPLFGKGWKVLVLEELEWLSPQTQAYLKVALETRMPSKLIVVATSNGAGKLQKALLQRFKICFFHGGEAFAEAAEEFLRGVWEQETGGQGGVLPSGVVDMGWDGQEYSLRKAIDALQERLAGRMVQHVA